MYFIRVLGNYCVLCSVIIVVLGDILRVIELGSFLVYVIFFSCFFEGRFRGFFIVVYVFS